MQWAAHLSGLPGQLPLDYQPPRRSHRASSPAGTPQQLSRGRQLTGKTSGTSRLYRLTGTRAAVATPKQLQLQSMAAATQLQCLWPATAGPSEAATTPAGCGNGGRLWWAATGAECRRADPALLLCHCQPCTPPDQAAGAAGRPKTRWQSGSGACCSPNGADGLSSCVWMVFRQLDPVGGRLAPPGNSTGARRGRHSDQPVAIVCWLPADTVIARLHSVSEGCAWGHCGPVQAALRCP